MGGEKKSSRCCTSIGLGSPPRRRGKGVDRKIALLRYGITPAWAGKRQGMTSSVRHPWDHPRVGGEKLRMGFLRGLVLGSPPHGRGKAFSVLRRQFRFRITPAWAGKSAPARARREKPQDHPRAGGEKRLRSAVRSSSTGSPPHRRGKAKQQAYEQLQSGITPAQAGKSR